MEHCPSAPLMALPPIRERKPSVRHVQFTPSSPYIPSAVPTLCGSLALWSLSAIRGALWRCPGRLGDYGVIPLTHLVN